MPRRNFRLQTLLNHKQQIEEQHTVELARLAGEEQRARDELELLRAEERKQLAALAELVRKGAVDTHKYATASAYIERLGAAIAEQIEAVQALAQAAETQRDELVDVMKERRSLERLRDRQQAEAAVEESRREGRQVDDLTSSRYARRGSEGTA
jgi:flagellar protein FliJ